MRNTIVRPATPEDVEAIRIAHRKSILEIAAKDYPAEVVAEWGTNNDPESIQTHKENIRSGAELCWVAVQNEIVVGFSSLIPEFQELRAVYVVGQAAHTGVGRALLQSLESKAIELGLNRLQLHSSVSARSFYERNGYRNLRKGIHKMRSGLEMECYIMDKQLAITLDKASNPAL